MRIVKACRTCSELSLRPKINDLKKIRIAAVSYLNTKPLLYGIKRHPVMEQIEMIEDYPSKIARMLIEDEVDAGLIPVAATLQMKNWELITNFCIGSDGPVASVCIFSQEPIDKIENLILDYQSRTSVNLAKVLLKGYWKKEVNFIDAGSEDYIAQIKGETAGVIIGDRALKQRKNFSYIYDLGEAWKLFTGLPFVFAGWISNKQLPPDFIRAFNEANAEGLHSIPQVVAENPFPDFNLTDYYTKFIDYNLDRQKMLGLNLFLEKLRSGA